MRLKPTHLLPILLAIVSSGEVTKVHAGDWPQILGPDRNGIAQDEQSPAWDAPPEIAWQADCGSGYSGVAVVGGKVFLWHRIDNSERLDCLQTVDGKLVWSANFPARYRGGYNNDHGPRSIPVVDRGQVFVYGAAGDLHAVDAATGKPLWSRELRQDYAADDGYFGAGSTPIVSGDIVVTAVGGEQGAGVVGVHRNTGKTLWKATELEADYASPIPWTESVVIVPMRMRTVALSTADGKLVFEVPFGQRGLNVIGATPTLSGNRLLLTASYQIGARMFDLAKNPPAEIWSGDDILSSQYNSGIVIDRFVYGIHGREDSAAATLRCVQWATGKVQWSQEAYGVAHLIGIGNRLISQRTDGTIELLDADPGQFKSLGKMQLPSGTYRAVPAYCDATLYCRMTQGNEGKLLALKFNN